MVVYPVANSEEINEVKLNPMALQNVVRAADQLLRA